MVRRETLEEELPRVFGVTPGPEGAPKFPDLMSVPVGTEHWDNLLRDTLRFWLWAEAEQNSAAAAEYYGAERLAMVSQQLETMYKEDPAHFDAIAQEVTKEFSAGIEDEKESQSLEDQLVSALTQYLSGSGPESRVSNVITNIVGKTTSETTRTTTERRLQYIEYATDEEILAGAENLTSSFLNSLAKYLGELTSAGKMSAADASYIWQNPDDLFLQYRQSIFEKGGFEALYKVVGIKEAGKEMKIEGERPGSAVATAIDSRIKTIEEQLQKLAATGTVTQGTTTTPTSEATTEQLRRELEELQKYREQYFETEVIASRPRAAVTLSYTPEQFLQETWTPEKLKLYTTQKRMAERKFATRAGPAPVRLV